MGLLRRATTVRRQGVALACFVLLLLATSLCTADFLSFGHQRLDGTAYEKVQSKNKPLVMLFFEPNCAWCFKQTKVINKALAACTKQFRVAGMGVNTHYHALRKAAWKLKPKFQTYQANQTMVVAMGGVKATPLMLLFNNEGQLLHHAQGYLDARQLAVFLKPILVINPCSELS